MTPSIKIETITPEIAQTYLDKYFDPERQRKLEPHTVDNYARKMRAGLWIFNPATAIVITEDGKLENGQHTLNAVIKSGVTINHQVSRGAPSAIGVMDRGRNRTTAQALAMRGETCTFEKAAIATAIFSLCAEYKAKPIGKLGEGEILVVLDTYRDEITYCMSTRSREIGIRNAPVTAACCFAMRPFQTELKDFHNKLNTGINLSKGSPALACRRWLQSSAHNGSHGRLETMHVVMFCAMKHIVDQDVYAIRDTDRGFEFFTKHQVPIILKILRSCGYLIN